MIKTALSAVALFAAAVPAAAVTITVDQSISAPDVSFYTTTQNFVLGAGFTNALLNIGTFSADDAAVVSINGTAIVSTGIFGPGNGNFFFTQAGPSIPFTFAYGNGPVNASFGAPFVVGSNTITITVNNNNAGINTGNGGLTGGPSNLQFTGTISFDAGTVPEPATWGLLIAGFGMVGVATRRRKAVVAA